MNQEFPFIVAIENKGDKTDRRNSFCAGFIYNRRFIITSALCVHGKDKNSIEVRAGSVLRLQGGDLYNVSEIRPHPGYNPIIHPPPFDIALLRLETYIDLARDYPNKEFISLGDDADWLLSTSNPADTAGWGMTGCQITESETIYELDDKLKKIEVLKINREFCNECWVKHFPAGVPERALCASTNPFGFATSRTCYGDFGAPLVFNDKVIAIVTAGLHGMCPDIFTTVWPYRTWIEDLAGFQDDAISVMLV